jgi:hypothetical protein
MSATEHGDNPPQEEASNYLQELHAEVARETHPATAHVLQYFQWAHLPHHLQHISMAYAAVAIHTAQACTGPEATVALRHLLQAKDAAVRACLPPLPQPLQKDTDNG